MPGETTTLEKTKAVMVVLKKIIYQIKTGV